MQRQMLHSKSSFFQAIKLVAEILAASASLGASVAPWRNSPLLNRIDDNNKLTCTSTTFLESFQIFATSRTCRIIHSAGNFRNVAFCDLAPEMIELQTPLSDSHQESCAKLNFKHLSVSSFTPLPLLFVDFLQHPIFCNIPSFDSELHSSCLWRLWRFLHHWRFYRGLLLFRLFLTPKKREKTLFPSPLWLG